MKTFLKTEKEKKAFIVAAIAVIVFFAISLLVAGKANAATGINAAGKVNAAQVRTKTIRQGAYCVRVLKGIKKGSRLSATLAVLGKPIFHTTLGRQMKLYYCKYSADTDCIVFSFVSTKLTTREFYLGKHSHYLLEKIKIAHY